MSAAVLLAAGESRRMGQPKALLPWRGWPLIQYQVAQLKLAGVSRIVVVLGHEADRIAPYLVGPGLTVAINQRYREGRASSLRIGAAPLPEDADPIVVLNVDQPRPAEVLRTLLEAHKLAGAAITAPVYEGRRGHPPIFSAKLLPDLRTVSDETQGLRAVMAAHAGSVHEVPLDDAVVLLDLNTPEGYEEARRRYGS